MNDNDNDDENSFLSFFNIFHSSCNIVYLLSFSLASYSCSFGINVNVCSQEICMKDYRQEYKIWMKPKSDAILIFV